MSSSLRVVVSKRRNSAHAKFKIFFITVRGANAEWAHVIGCEGEIAGWEVSFEGRIFGVELLYMGVVVAVQVGGKSCQNACQWGNIKDEVAKKYH